MPRYEYLCNSCGKSFEVVQKMSDAPLTQCTCCDEGTVQRLVSSGSGLIFKGSGFYITDYKNSGSSSATSSTATAESTPAKAEAPVASGGTCGSGGCASCS